MLGEDPDRRLREGSFGSPRADNCTLQPRTHAAYVAASVGDHQDDEEDEGEEDDHHLEPDTSAEVAVDTPAFLDRDLA